MRNCSHNVLKKKKSTVCGWSIKRASGLKLIDWPNNPMLITL